jgi:hypothetical protein
LNRVARAFLFSLGGHGSKGCALCGPWLDFQEVERGNELRFEVKGQEYFLAFVEQENRWYVFAPSPAGMQRMPVYVDAARWERIGTAEAGRHNISN